MASTQVSEDVEVETKIEYPKMWKVLLHNDNHTTFDFVIALLTHVFYKTIEEAQAITFQIHTNGHGVAGVYTKEVAEEKVNESTTYARSEGFPLIVTAEPD